MVFVTHDIDEAIKMGDKVAILREGGVLAQFDSPDAILARPVDDFVAQFVGADRGLKRLSLRRVGDLELLPAVSAQAGDDAAVARERARVAASETMVLVDRDRRPLGLIDVGALDGDVKASSAQPIAATGALDMPLDDALSVMLSQTGSQLVVVDGDGRVAGLLTADLISEVLSGRAAGR